MFQQLQHILRGSEQGEIYFLIVGHIMSSMNLFWINIALTQNTIAQNERK